VHSPLLAPVTWLGVASELRREGWTAVVPDLRTALAGDPPYYPSLFEAARRAAVGSASPVVVVGHSAAGPLLPGVIAALDTPVSTVVFVDARLPHPGLSWLETLPAERAEALRAQAQEGFLPRWDTWFPPEAVAGLLPDSAVRQAFQAELPEVPWGLLTETLPPLPPSWNGMDHVYVQLSDAYRAESDHAAGDRYRVIRHDGDHLSPMTRPAKLSELLQQIVR